MSSTPKNIHVTSQTYLRGWSVDGRTTMLVKPSDGTHERRRISTVAKRRYWWGRSPHVAAEVERVLGVTEQKATPFLRNPARRWPPSREDRVQVSLFMGIHLIRSPAFRAWSAGAAYSVIAKHIEKHPQHEEHIPAFATFLTAPASAAEHALREIPRAASIAASMRWTLVSFDEPMLLTTEQPVSLVPVTIETSTVTVQSVPPGGLMTTLEWRFPVNPRAALILSWHDSPDEARVRHGDVSIASTLNAALVAQSPGGSFFRHPDRIPATLQADSLEAVCAPVARIFTPDYDAGAALRSRRRREAEGLISQLIDGEIEGQVSWVRVETPGDRAA